MPCVYGEGGGGGEGGSYGQSPREEKEDAKFKVVMVERKGKRAASRTKQSRAMLVSNQSYLVFG